MEGSKQAIRSGQKKQRKAQEHFYCSFPNSPNRVWKRGGGHNRNQVTQLIFLHQDYESSQNPRGKERWGERSGGGECALGNLIAESSPPRCHIV